MTILEALKQYVDAEGVSEKTFQAIAKISEVKTYEAGGIVHREDETSASLNIVLSGQVDVQYLLESGKRQTVDTLLAGDFLVWSAIVKPYKTSSIAICRAQADVLAIEASALRDLFEKEPLLGYRMTSQIARVIRRRLQAARQQIADLD